MTHPDAFSRSTREKASALLRRAGGLRPDDEQPDIWWARSSNGSDVYRVQINRQLGWVSCTCPHGLHVGMASCYHAAALLLHLAELEAAEAEEEEAKAPVGGGTTHLYWSSVPSLRSACGRMLLDPVTYLTEDLDAVSCGTCRRSRRFKTLAALAAAGAPKGRT